MNKLFLSFAAMAVVALGFTSCEDVPMPYDQPGTKTDTTKVVVTELGSGTVEDPYNIARAQKIISDGTYTTDNVYVKGIVTSVDIDTNYGNATYYLSDDGTTTGATSPLEVYRGYYYNGDRFTTGHEIQVGDTVVVYGQLTSYNGTPEVTQRSQVYSINGKTSGTTPGTKGTPTGSGTAADPYNSVAANEAGAKLSSDETIEGVYVKGRVSKIDELDTGSYGNATYYISDTGTSTDQFEVYRGYYLNGAKFTSTDQLKVGDSVVVRGDIVNFRGTTVEMTQRSQIVYINGNGSEQPASNTGLNETFADGQGSFTINDITKSDELDAVWKWNSSKYMRATGYVSRTKVYATESRLTSPAFSLEGLATATLTFEHAERYFNDAAAELKVQVSTDGNNWTDLTANYSDGSNWTFVTTTIDLSAYAGQKTVYIGFLYTSTADNAATWEVRNVVVK